MGLELEIRSGAAAITLNTVDLRTRAKTLRNQSAQRVGEEITWQVKALLRGDTPEEVAQKRQQLLEILADEPVAATLFAGATKLEALDEATVADGPFVEEKASGSNSLMREVEVAFTIRAFVFDSTDAIVEADVTTEHIWDEEVYSRRVTGAVYVREGADAYSAAMRFQPPLPAGARWLRRKVVITPKNRAEFEFCYTTAPTILPRGVSFCRKIVAVYEEGGRKVVDYEAEFRGSGADEAAKNYKPSGDVIESRIERGDNFVKVRYRVLERGEAEEVVMRRFVVRGGGREVKAVGGQNRVAVFQGVVKPVEVEERGEAIRCGAVPQVAEPIKLPNLVVSQRRYEAEPETLDVSGNPVAWRLKWHFVYVVNQAVAEPSGLLTRLLSAASAGAR